MSISVVLPVYSVTKFLGEALRSISAAATEPVEVIVIDDGNSPPLNIGRSDLTNLAVTTLRRPHRGAGAARNSGVSAASGEVLMFLDADDCWLAPKCAVQVPALLNDPEAAHVAWAKEFLDPSTAWGSGPRPHERLLTGPTLSTLAVRREIFEEVGPFREDLGAAEGIDWFLRAERADVRVIVCEEVLAERRIHARNRDRAARPESSDYLRVLREHLQFRSTHEGTQGSS